MGQNAKPKHYKDLLVWQRGTSQMRRAAVSVPSNIAEGQARHGTKEFLQFLSHAEGSLAELETQALLSVELELARPVDVQPILGEIDELQKMLIALKRKLAVYSPLATRHSPLQSAERR